MSDEMGTTTTVPTESESRLAGTEQVKPAAERVRLDDDGDIESEYGTPIAIVLTYCGEDDAKANAAFIVRAWNAHDDLVAALKPLGFCDPQRPPHGVKVEDWSAAVEAARLAVAKAIGRTP